MSEHAISSEWESLAAGTPKVGRNEGDISKSRTRKHAHHRFDVAQAIVDCKPAQRARLDALLSLPVKEAIEVALKIKHRTAARRRQLKRAAHLLDTEHTAAEVQMIQTVVGRVRDGSGVPPSEERAVAWRATILRGGAAADALAEELAPLAMATGADVSDLMRVVRGAQAEALDGAAGKRPADRRLYAALQPLAIEALLREARADGADAA